jgi:hypothetical protein
MHHEIRCGRSPQSSWNLQGGATMNWTGPPRNGEPQTGQSLGQKTTPNASGISYTLRAESTLRRYARLGYWHFLGLLPLFHRLGCGRVALDLLGYDSKHRCLCGQCSDREVL